MREISSDSASPSYTLYFHLLPVLVLWNPYNVALEATPYTFRFWRNTFPGANEFPYWNQCHPERFRVDAESGPTEASEENPIDTSTRWLPYVFKRKAIFNLPAVAFQPGEAKIFTPAQHSDATDGMILVEGFRPGMSFLLKRLQINVRQVQSSPSICHLLIMTCSYVSPIADAPLLSYTQVLPF